MLFWRATPSAIAVWRAKVCGSDLNGGLAWLTPLRGLHTSDFITRTTCLSLVEHNLTHCCRHINAKSFLHNIFVPTSSPCSPPNINIKKLRILNVYNNYVHVVFICSYIYRMMLRLLHRRWHELSSMGQVLLLHGRQKLKEQRRRMKRRGWLKARPWPSQFIFNRLS